MTAFIELLTPYFPAIVAVFSSLLCVIAGLGKFGTAIKAFTKSNEVKELRAKLADAMKENTEIRNALAETVAAQKNLVISINDLIKSDQFMANREKADFTEITKLCGNMNKLYSNMLATTNPSPVVEEEEVKVAEVPNDTDNEDTPQ